MPTPKITAKQVVRLLNAALPGAVTGTQLKDSSSPLPLKPQSQTLYYNPLLDHPFPYASSCPVHWGYSKFQDLATSVGTCSRKAAQLPAKTLHFAVPLRIWSEIHMQLLQHGPFARGECVHNLFIQSHEGNHQHLQLWPVS